MLQQLKSLKVSLYKRYDKGTTKGKFYIKDKSPILIVTPDGKFFWHPERLVKVQSNDSVFRFSTGVNFKLKTKDGNALKVKGKLEASGIKQATDYRDNYLKQKELKLKELTDDEYQQQKIKELYEGRNPVKLMKPKDTDPDGLLELYIKKRQNSPNPESRLSEKTIKEYRTSFKALVSRVGLKNIDEYTYEDCTAFISIILNEAPRCDSRVNVKDKTLRKYHDNLNRCFEWAMEKRNGIFLKENHWKNTDLTDHIPNLDYQRQPDPFTAEEFWQVHSFLTREIDKDFTEFVFYTGMRDEELQELKLEWINVEAKYINIKVTKTGVPRMIPLPTALIPTIIKAINRGQTYVIEQPSRKGLDKHINTHELSKRVKKAIRTALGNDCKKSLYDIRATYGSLLQQQGYSLEKVSKLLGHKHYSTTQKYYINSSPVAYTDSVDAMEIIANKSLTKVLTDNNPVYKDRINGGKWKYKNNSFLKNKLTTQTN